MCFFFVVQELRWNQWFQYCLCPKKLRNPQACYLWICTCTHVCYGFWSWVKPSQKSSWNGFISKSFLPGAMAPFSCFPGGSGRGETPSSWSTVEEQSKRRTAGGWDFELGNGMGNDVSETHGPSMVGNFELNGLVWMVGLRGRSWWKWESYWKRWLVWVKGGFVYTSFIFIYLFKVLSFRKTHWLPLFSWKTSFWVSQHQSAVHFRQGWLLRLHVLQMSKRAFQSLLNGFEPEVLTSTRPEVTSDRGFFSNVGMMF